MSDTERVDSRSPSGVEAAHRHGNRSKGEAADQAEDPDSTDVAVASDAGAERIVHPSREPGLQDQPGGGNGNPEEEGFAAEDR